MYALEDEQIVVQKQLPDRHDLVVASQLLAGATCRTLDDCMDKGGVWTRACPTCEAHTCFGANCSYNDSGTWDLD